MIKNLFDSQPFLRILFKQSFKQIACLFWDAILELVLRFYNNLLQFTHIVSLERHSSVKHSEQDHPCTPNISTKAFITLIHKYFRCNIGWSATLLGHDLSLANNFAHTKVTNLDLSIPCKQYVIQFNVPMQNVLAMTVTNAFNKLLKHAFSNIFFQLSSLSHIVEQISSRTDLNYKQDMLLCFEVLIQSNNVAMSCLF